MSSGALSLPGPGNENCDPRLRAWFVRCGELCSLRQAPALYPLVGTFKPSARTKKLPSRVCRRGNSGCCRKGAVALRSIRLWSADMVAFWDKGSPHSERVRDVAVSDGTCRPPYIPTTSIWGSEYGNEREYLCVLINQLRKKIEDDPARPSYILTESYIGYRFREA